MFARQKWPLLAAKTRGRWAAYISVVTSAGPQPPQGRLPDLAGNSGSCRPWDCRPSIDESNPSSPLFRAEGFLANRRQEQAKVSALPSGIVNVMGSRRIPFSSASSLLRMFIAIPSITLQLAQGRPLALADHPSPATCWRGPRDPDRGAP
jgi:hypothetical protein